MLSGTLAAALTPFTPGADALDLGVIPSYAEWLLAHGASGVLSAGTTGESVLLSEDEHRRLAEAWRAALRGRGLLAVHAGAQTTGETVRLAAHAKEIGADAVAVIGPPYFALDAEELFCHFKAAADACAPVPFYVYEFAARAGYALPIPMLHRLKATCSNVVGLKVSDAPFEKFKPYLLEGWDVFVGPEACLVDGLAHGAKGAVSGLASVYPDRVSAVVRRPDAAAGAAVAALRASMQSLPFHAAGKAILRARGVPIGPDVRRPLRGLTPDEARVAAAIAAANP